MSRPLSLQLYRAATALAEPFAPALLGGRARRGKEEPARLGERLGRASLPRPEGPLVWLHGASVGEGLSLLPLIEALRRARPELAVLVTSGTVTSAELLAQRLPPGVIHQYAPVDAPAAARRFLDHWRPALAVFVESEVWPNLLLAARAGGVRTALVSARLSERSLRGWARSPAAARALFGGFDLVLAQDETTGAGLARLGARDDGRLNLKRAGAPLPFDPDVLAAYRRASNGRPLLLAASTHPGEDAPVLDAFGRVYDHPRRPRLVIVPRHPVRGGEVTALSAARWTTTRQGIGQPFGVEDVHVADVLGELGVWFRMAVASFVAGSWAEGVGGHNPLEPARLACAVASGPHVDNWREVYADLAAEEAVRWAEDSAALAAFWRAALDEDPAVVAQADRALAFTGREDGAVDRAAARLLALLDAGLASGPSG